MGHRIYCRDIVLKTDELLTDIADRLSLTADGFSPAGDADVHNTKDVLDDGNREIVLGLIARYVAECMNILYPYAKTPLIRECAGDRPDCPQAYVIRLTFDRMGSETCIRQLVRCVHDYIVYKCYAEWLEITLPLSNLHTLWEQKAADVREQIVTLLVLPYEPKSLRVRPRWY